MILLYLVAPFVTASLKLLLFSISHTCNYFSKNCKKFSSLIRGSQSQPPCEGLIKTSTENSKPITLRWWFIIKFDILWHYFNKTLTTFGPTVDLLALCNHTSTVINFT